MKRTIYFDNDLWRALEKAARQIGQEERRTVSVSELLRLATVEWLESFNHSEEDAPHASRRPRRKGF